MLDGQDYNEIWQKDLPANAQSRCEITLFSNGLIGCRRNGEYSLLQKETGEILNTFLHDGIQLRKDGRQIATAVVLDDWEQQLFIGKLLPHGKEQGEAKTMPYGSNEQCWWVEQFSPNAMVLAVQGRRQRRKDVGFNTGVEYCYGVALWDAIRGGQIAEILPATAKQPWQIAFQPQGDFCATGNSERGTLLWQLKQQPIAVNVTLSLADFIEWESKTEEEIMLYAQKMKDF